MDSDFSGPVNIGSEEMVRINDLVDITAKAAGKAIKRVHNMNKPLGVRGRNSNNDLVREKLGWDYEQPLAEGIKKTYDWICTQICKKSLDVEGGEVTLRDGSVQFIDEVCSV